MREIAMDRTPFSDNSAAVAIEATPASQSPERQTPARAAARSDSPQHFAFVDSLRGFAILGVIMVHCCLNSENIHWRLHDIGMAGMYGVQLFFVVSAFTLFWSLHSRSGSDQKPLHAFYVRRFFRIAPLFWLAAIFYTAQHWASLTTHGPTTVSPATFIATLFFVHGWNPVSVNTVVPGGWSIGAEFMFYLCIPVLFRYIRSLTGAYG